MTRIRFIPAQIKTFPDERSDACTYCGSPILTRHGTAEKSVTDLYIEKVTTVRYRCSDCGRTFRHYPEGTTAADRPRGCADGRRSRGRSACRRAPRAARCRLRRIRIAHERMARRPGSGTERAPQTGRTGARTGDSHRRGRDCGSRQGRDNVRRRGHGRLDRRSLGAGRPGQARFGQIHGVARRLRARLRRGSDGRGRPEYLQAGGRASGT